jgi:uncharacterized protein YndB with AHSA1/START domain
VEPPERLALGFVWEEPDPDDDARRELHREGWGETLDKLAAWL